MATEPAGERSVTAALNSRAAARYLSVGLSKLYDLVRAGDLAYLDLGGQYGFLEADLDAYLYRCRIPSKTEAEAPIEIKRESLTVASDVISIFTGQPVAAPAARATRGGG